MLFPVGPGAGLETPGPRSLGLAPLTIGIEEAEPAAEGPSLVGGAAPDLSPLFFFPNKNDMIALWALRRFAALRRPLRAGRGQ